MPFFGVGGFSPVQAVPFHDSANGKLPDTFSYVPTAAQAFADLHETLAKAP